MNVSGSHHGLQLNQEVMEIASAISVMRLPILSNDGTERTNK